MKIENMLKRFSCISFLFKPPCIIDCRKRPKNSEFLKKFTFGDPVLSEEGFNLHDEIASAGAVLKIPCFTKRKWQLSQCEVDTSRQISNLRIDGERIIGRLKNFRYLQSTVPTQQVDLLDNVMTIVSGCVNLNQKIASIV